jgi:hypothetical protein
LNIHWPNLFEILYKIISCSSSILIVIYFQKKVINPIPSSSSFPREFPVPVPTFEMSWGRTFGSSARTYSEIDIPPQV